MSTHILPPRPRAIVAALISSVCIIGSTAVRADAQGTVTPRGTLQGTNVSTTISKSVAAVPPTTLAPSFRAGLTASSTPTMVTSGLSPLSSVTLSWAPFPGASGYQVLRQALTGAGSPYAPVLIPSLPVHPAPTSATVSVPPFVGTSSGWGQEMQFRVVAIVSGRAIDTTAPVSVKLPHYHAQQNSLVSSSLWPAPTTAPFASVGARSCQITGTTATVVWARNPDAVSYKVDLVKNGGTTGFNPLATLSTTDTTVSTTLPAAAVLIMVRPEFAVHDWPAPGQTSTFDGEWLYLGTAHSPAPSGATVPCSQH